MQSVLVQFARLHSVSDCATLAIIKQPKPNSSPDSLWAALGNLKKSQCLHSISRPIHLLSRPGNATSPMADGQIAKDNIMALAPQTTTPPNPSGTKAPLVKKIYIVAFCWVTSLFFMWAIANNFNDILIKQFQKALDLSKMQSGLVQTAFYFGYFTMALPAGWMMTKVGYKNGILIGLALYAIGGLCCFYQLQVL